MMRLSISMAILALLCAGSAEAELYKSVDAKGHITYSDTPPSSDKVVTRAFAPVTDEQDTAVLPYALRQAAHNHPVVLYTAPDCAPCQQARDYLKQSGIPYKEKTVSSNEDAKRFGQLFTSNMLPLMTVGSDKLPGFNSDIWKRSIQAAGYPADSKLPANYQNGQASALVTTKEQVASADRAPNQSSIQSISGQPSQAERPRAIIPAPSGTPAGFRF